MIKYGQNRICNRNCCILGYCLGVLGLDNKSNVTCYVFLPVFNVET